MTYALIYVFFWAIWLYGNVTGFDFSMDYSHLFSDTNVLMAFGIIGICNRLDKLIELNKKK